jgi:hypothetical protein
MRLPAALCALLLVGVLAARGSAQAEKALRPAYTPLPTLDAEVGEVVALPIQVAPIPDALREEFKIHPFYKKHVVIRGIPVIGAEEVTDYAFLECAWTLDHILYERNVALNALLAAKVRVGIIGVTQYTMDIPENQRPRMMAKAAYNDRRSRGLGGLPMATCAEENLLNLRGDPYTRENITIHEFAHTLASAIRRMDRAWYDKLRDAYNQAKEKGIYGRSYASTNEQEYWAEGAQCWFDCANPRNSGGASNRDELKAKDAPLAALLNEVYGDTPWRYVKTERRTAAADTAHLAGMDRTAYPVFRFSDSPRIKAEAEAAREAATPEPAPNAAPAKSQPTAATIEQTEAGTRPSAEIVASFDGLGEGFEGPQGKSRGRNPSDNSLAVGPNHIVQIVNSQMAVFTKAGEKFDVTGKVLYGPVPTNNVFRGFAGEAAQMNNGDAVVRYDQLADRWLIVMPIFRRLPPKEAEPPAPKAGEAAHFSLPSVAQQPGPAEPLFQPPAPAVSEAANRPRPAAPRPAAGGRGSYAICYAISTSSDPLGSYYRYQFVRPLFPDYPRLAVWPDGYYVATSTGDDVVQKHIYVVEREKMLKGEPAREQGLIIDDVNFLNCADLDGKRLPPAGAPNLVLATGGTQLKNVVGDDGIYAWKMSVNWDDAARTSLSGPAKIPVAPYEYLGGGQLTRTVPQPGTDVRLDSQGDKIMARLVYRRIGNRESLVAVHSVNTSGGGGAVRWYEFRLDDERNVVLHQQGTYCPQGGYRWMASPAIDALGNIGIGYSFGDAAHFPGQRFAARQAGDPLGILSLREAVMVEGQAAQTSTFRWEDYSQTAVDPSDDRTIWYVGDYLKEGATSYSTRIAAFRIADGRVDRPAR